MKKWKLARLKMFYSSIKDGDNYPARKIMRQWIKDLQLSIAINGDV